MIPSPPVLVLTGLMAVVLLVAWLWSRASLRGVEYRRRLKYRRGFAGEVVPLEVVAQNRKALPLAWLRTLDPLPLPLAPDDPDLLLPSNVPNQGLLSLLLFLRGFQRVRRTFDLRFRTRGVYEAGPCTAASGDPFGLYQAEASVQPAERVVVYPARMPLEDLGLRPADPFGERRSPRRLFDDAAQPIGVREYRPQDGFRRIHWPATARAGRLQSRVLQPISGLDLVVCLNAATFPRYWEGTNPRLLEALVRAAASVSEAGIARGYRVGLICNGSIAHADRPFRIPPGRSPQQLPRLLESLAGLTPIVTAPFERFLLAQAPRLEYGSSMVAITAVVSAALGEALLRLRARCRRVTLLSMAEEPPEPIAGVEILHRPWRAEVAA